MKGEGGGGCLVALSVQASLEVAFDVGTTSLPGLRVALLLLHVAWLAAFASDRKKP